MILNKTIEIKEESIALIKDDYTELWLLIAIIQEKNPHLNSIELKEATKIIIGELVENGNISVMNTDTNESMNLSVEDILFLVEERFKTLGRVPNIGDGIWFMHVKT